MVNRVTRAGNLLKERQVIPGEPVMPENVRLLGVPLRGCDLHNFPVARDAPEDTVVFHRE
jgi:hypothetical protein